MIPLIQGFSGDEEARGWIYEVSICNQAGEEKKKKVKPASCAIWNSYTFKATKQIADLPTAVWKSSTYKIVQGSWSDFLKRADTLILLCITGFTFKNAKKCTSLSIC